MSDVDFLLFNLKSKQNYAIYCLLCPPVVTGAGESQNVYDYEINHNFYAYRLPQCQCKWIFPKGEFE